MTVSIRLGESHVLGETPSGRRRIDTVAGGRFEGERLRGEILPGGADALLTRGDGSVRPDVRLLLRTDDGALIFMTYSGVRHGPPEVMRRLAEEEEVGADEYYLRTTPRFETASARYAWLNRIIAVGVGRRIRGGAEYDIFEIL
jgi:hypothetical protein